MLERFKRWFLNFPLSAPISYTTVVGLITLLFVFNEWRNGGDKTFEKITRIIELGILSIGICSIWLLVSQLVQTRRWNQHLSYHQFFGDFPERSKIKALREKLAGLQISQPTIEEPLTRVSADKLLSDTSGIDALCDYLNDVEEFSLAVNQKLVDQDYAFYIEGRRIIEIFFGFEVFINRLRADQQTKMQNNPNLQFATSYYCELEILARDWLEKKKKRHAKSEEVKSIRPTSTL
jgi:hypothetical protein